MEKGIERLDIVCYHPWDYSFNFNIYNVGQFYDIAYGIRAAGNLSSLFALSQIYNIFLIKHKTSENAKCL